MIDIIILEIDGIKLLFIFYEINYFMFKIVIIFVFSDLVIVRKVMNLGVFDLLIKFIDLEDLENIVNKILNYV